jgi:hypothetical protein
MQCRREGKEEVVRMGNRLLLNKIKLRKLM